MWVDKLAIVVPQVSHEAVHSGRAVYGGREVEDPAAQVCLVLDVQHSFEAAGQWRFAKADATVLGLCISVPCSHVYREPSKWL